MQKLSKEQAIILTGFTGVLCGTFADFHEDAEIRVGRPVWAHEFGSGEFVEEIKELYKDDFFSIQPEDTNVT